MFASVETKKLASASETGDAWVITAEEFTLCSVRLDRVLLILKPSAVVFCRTHSGMYVYLGSQVV
jgi:hypothetical protein